MRDLRLIGVHEDGQHLLLSDSEGERYRVELDEPLRVAARRDRARLGQLQIEIDGGMRPREVQALIRAGLSAEDVADRAGWPVEKVRRYEGPILAEREHVAGLAQTVRLRGSGGGGSASAPTLATRVSQRLAGRGVDPSTAQWDAARAERGDWTVIVTFPAGGRERQARWSFDVQARTVLAADDEARWLSEEDSTGTLPTPHLVTAPARSSSVYDVEAEGGLSSTGRRHTGQAEDEPLDLMSAMRERAAHRGRSRRRRAAPSQTPLDEAPREDALPLEDIAFDPDTMPPPPPARGTHPQDEPAPQVPADVGDDVLPKGSTAAPEPAAGDEDDPTTNGSAAGTSDRGPADGSATGPSRRPARKGGRTSVPSWDDVMFGAKPRD